jgi:hypothetical protein
MIYLISSFPVNHSYSPGLVVQMPIIFDGFIPAKENQSVLKLSGLTSKYGG